MIDFDKVDPFKNLSIIQLYEKETLAQVFFCEFCEISKSTFFTEHHQWLQFLVIVPAQQTFFFQSQQWKHQNILRKKCPFSELFWSVFSCIRTECGPE